MYHGQLTWVSLKDPSLWEMKTTSLIQVMRSSLLLSSLSSDSSSISIYIFHLCSWKIGRIFFSSPEPKAHRWAYNIGRHPSSVRRRPSSTFSNDISSDERCGPWASGLYDCFEYRTVPKFSERKGWETVDPDQIGQGGAVWSGSTLFAIPSAAFGRVTQGKTTLYKF